MKGYKSKTQVLVHNEAKKVVKRAMAANIERKFWDGQEVYTAVNDSTGLIYDLLDDPNASTSFAAGTLATDTIGESITPVRLRLKFGVSVASGTPERAIVRVVIAQSRGPITTPTLADLLQSNVNFVLSDYDTQRVGLPGARSYLHVLYDHCVVVDPAGPSLKFLKVTIPRKKLRKLRFEPSTVAANDVLDGSLWLFLVSDKSSNFPEVKYYSRLEYTDA